MSPTTPARIGVLVVEDERTIGTMLELVLRPQGFVVWTATGGQEAIDLFRQHAGKIHIVLLDVQMPGHDGPQTLRSLRAIRPEVACCFMSGHTGKYTEQELLDLGAVRVFHKPFSLTEAAAELRRLVGSPERRNGLRATTPAMSVTLGGQQARLRDQSRGGLGLWAHGPVTVGAVLDLQFDDGANPDCAVEVRHCRPEADGWAVGCRFVG